MVSGGGMGLQLVRHSAAWASHPLQAKHTTSPPPSRPSCQLEPILWIAVIVTQCVFVTANSNVQMSHRAITGRCGDDDDYDRCDCARSGAIAAKFQFVTNMHAMSESVASEREAARYS